MGVVGGGGLGGGGMGGKGGWMGAKPADFFLPPIAQ